MRYLASEKAEIIELVEQSHLPAKRTLDKLGIPRATFYRWYDRYREGGPEALEDHRSRPDRVWNRIPDDVRDQMTPPTSTSRPAPKGFRARRRRSRRSPAMEDQMESRPELLEEIEATFPSPLSRYVKLDRYPSERPAFDADLFGIDAMLDHNDLLRDIGSIAADAAKLGKESVVKIEERLRAASGRRDHYDLVRAQWRAYIDEDARLPAEFKPALPRVWREPEYMLPIEPEYDDAE